MYMRKMHVSKTKFKTAQIIALGFAAIILLGALLLSLPIAWAPGHQIKFIDALFTSHHFYLCDRTGDTVHLWGVVRVRTSCYPVSDPAWGIRCHNLRNPSGPGNGKACEHT